jgi:ATP dependent DNA ligase domain
MLARSGRLPTHGDWSFEVKWDGFRALGSTERGLRVRSRRGWDMTEHVGFLAGLPVRAVLDGELVALDEEGKPDFPLVCERILMRRHGIPLTFMAFDVLSLDGPSLMTFPTGSAGGSSRGSAWTVRTGGHRRRSTTARLCGSRSAGTSSRASSRNVARAGMRLASAAG